jgi:hypothetical protein
MAVPATSIKQPAKIEKIRIIVVDFQSARGLNPYIRKIGLSDRECLCPAPASACGRNDRSKRVHEQLFIEPPRLHKTLQDSP